MGRLPAPHHITAVRLAAVLLIALAALGTAPSVPAQAPPREWKLSTAVGPAFALGKAGARWATLIGEKSAGSLAVKLHPGATLAQRDPAREFAALRDGGAELAVGSTLQWAAAVPELGVVGLPWLASGAPQLAALAAEPFAGRLAAAMERAGVVALAFAPMGHRALATVGKAVREPADVAGLAVRVPALPAVAALYAALGASPQVLEFAAAQAAFKSGALGAQDGSAGSFVAARLEAAGFRHVADWQAIGEVGVFAVNAKVWSAWTDAERALVRAAAIEAAGSLATLARDESVQGLAELRQRGMAVTRLTLEGRAAFAAASRAAYDRAATAAGEELVRAAEAAVAAAVP
jgi:TRAP-type C4-dicarboxylate transport system substrate-binding protein